MRKLNIAASVFSIIVFSITLVACDKQAVSEGNGSVAMSAPVPTLLRSLPNNGLTATISFNEEPGTEYSVGADGTWSILVDLLPNQQYTIDIGWRFAGMLVMEEYGEFFTDPDNPVIELELNFLTTGFPRFDDDCDGVSNLQEADPEAVQIPTVNNCNDTESTIDLNESFNPVWINHEFSIGSEPLTRYTQPIKVQSYPINLSSAFTIWLYDDTPGPDNNHAFIQFRYLAAVDNEPAKKVVVVDASNATYSQLTEIDGTTCETKDNQGIKCTVPYEWKDEYWYEVEFDESTPGNWQTSILDPETDENLPLVVINADRNWEFSVISIAFEYVVSAAECLQPFEPRTAQYVLGTVNNAINTTTRGMVQSDCVLANNQWNISRRNIDDDALYSFTLGTP